MHFAPMLWNLIIYAPFPGLSIFIFFLFFKPWSPNDTGRLKQGYFGLLEISKAVCIHVIILINDSFVTITTPIIQYCANLPEELMHSTAQRRSTAGKCVANEWRSFSPNFPNDRSYTHTNVASILHLLILAIYDPCLNQS